MANQLTNATWTFAGGKWTNVTGNVTGAPSGRINFGIAYDSLHKEVLVYGGLDQLNVFNGSEFSNETWAYAAGSWSRLSASGSPYNPQSMVYDPADNETVLLGSSNITVSPPNVVTWTFSAGNWSVAAPAFVTRTRTADVGHAFTLSVTTSPNAGGLVYRYSGLPTGCAPQNTPSLTCVPTQVGTFPVVVSITGSAGFAATARTTVRVNPSPAVLGVSPSLATGEVGIPMGFVVNATPGSGNLTYSYVGLPTGCASANAPQLLCVPTAAGAFDVTANVADAIGVTAFGVAHTTVAPALQVLALRASAVAIDAGQSLQLSATLEGGVGPNGISYTGLPAGCATASVATLSCRPTGTGSFVVGVGATDALGASASGTTTVVVNPLPSVASFVSSSASVLPGASVQFTTTPAGGTAPFAYQYAGVPTGCQAGNAAVVTCASVPAGNYTVTVTIVDATGATATASTSFRAAGPASPAPSGSTVGGWFGSAGFWGGLALGAVAIVAAVAIGGYRLRLARQGEAIVEGLQTTDTGPSPAEVRDSISAGREDDLGR